MNEVSKTFRSDHLDSLVAGEQPRPVQLFSQTATSLRPRPSEAQLPSQHSGQRGVPGLASPVPHYQSQCLALPSNDRPLAGTSDSRVEQGPSQGTSMIMSSLTPSSIILGLAIALCGSQSGMRRILQRAGWILSQDRWFYDDTFDDQLTDSAGRLS